MNAISLWLTRLTLSMVFLLLSALFILPLYFMLEGFLSHQLTLRTILGILGLAWFLLIMQTSHVMASRMVFEGLGFLAAFRLSLAEARVTIGLMPIIGRWVIPAAEKPDVERTSPIE